MSASMLSDQGLAAAVRKSSELAELMMEVPEVLTGPVKVSFLTGQTLEFSNPEEAQRWMIAEVISAYLKATRPRAAPEECVTKAFLLLGEARKDLTRVQFQLVIAGRLGALGGPVFVKTIGEDIVRAVP